jgi:heat shock protein 90kDa beta
MKGYYATLKKTLEINPKHPLILGLKKQVEKGETSVDLEEKAQVLYETSLLRSGFDLKDTLDFAARVERVLRGSLGVDLEAEAEVEVAPAPEKSEEEDKSESKDGEAEAEEVEHDEL